MPTRGADGGAGGNGVELDSSHGSGGGGGGGGGVMLLAALAVVVPTVEGLAAAVAAAVMQIAALAMAAMDRRELFSLLTLPALHPICSALRYFPDKQDFAMTILVQRSYNWFAGYKGTGKTTWEPFIQGSFTFVSDQTNWTAQFPTGMYHEPLPLPPDFPQMAYINRVRITADGDRTLGAAGEI